MFNFPNNICFTIKNKFFNLKIEVSIGIIEIMLFNNTNTKMILSWHMIIIILYTLLLLHCILHVNWLENEQHMCLICTNTNTLNYTFILH